MQIHSGKSILAVVVAGLATTLLPAATFAQSQQEVPREEGIGEQIGQEIDQGIRELGDELRGGWAALRQMVDRFGVQARVYSRLRWDKNVASQKIEVDASEAGVVTLRGQLDRQSAKQQAIELAQDTIGVERVVDQLTVKE